MSNFAHVIELKRHLEILLLDNDCVVVPDFGGFVAYHVSAHFDETDNTFIPPMRTLGFNPQLKMNDSLLAQSYVEAYDISYPEAIQRIENEVAELRETIAQQGSYILDGIGTLSGNDEGGYLFTPCEAGILTPDLYGLNTFNLAPIAESLSLADTNQKTEETAKADVPAPKVQTPATQTKSVAIPQPTLTEILDEDEDEERTISIKLSWIRNTVAVAASVILFLMMSTPIANSNYSSQAITGLKQDMVYQLVNKDASDKPAITKSVVETIQEPVADATNTQELNSEPVRKIEKEAISAKSAEKPAVTRPSNTARPYCLVLASRVKKANAEEFVKKLKDRGFKDTEIYIHNNVVRVTYGHFRTEDEAYSERNNLRFEDDFTEAWVYKKTNV